MTYSLHQVLPSYLSAFGESYLLTGILYLIVWAGLPMIAGLLLRASGRKLLQISTATTVFWLIILLSHIGFLVLFFELDVYRVVARLVDKQLILLCTVYSGLALVGLALGVYFTSKTQKLSMIQAQESRVFVKTPETILPLVFLLGLVSLAVMVAFVQTIPSVPLFIVMGLEQGDLQIAKSSGGNLFDGRFYIYNIFLTALPPFLCAVAYGMLLERQNLLRWGLFLALMALAVFGSVVLASKGELVMFWLLLILMHVLRKGGHFKLGPIVLLFLGGSTLAILVMQFFEMQSRDVLSVYWAVLSRVFAGGYNAYQYIQIFPEHIDFLNGRTFVNPGGAFPFDNFRLTVEVQNYLRPEDVALGLQGSAPTTFWGDLYANFGLLGIIIFSPIIGIYIGLLDAILSRLAPSVLTSAFTAWVAIHVANLAVTSFHYLVLDTRLYTITVIFLLFSLLGNLPLGFNYIRVRANCLSARN